mgnify:FL=1
MTTSVDNSNMYKSIYDFSSNIESAFTIGEKILLNNNYNSINRVVIAGMGGSAIGGDVVRLLLSSSKNIPITVSRNYNLPSWVDENSLVICSSYSGHTEETLSSFDDAKNKNSKIISISTGGFLKDLTIKNDLDFIKIPKGLQPRAALAFSFVPIIYLLIKIGIISVEILEKLKNSLAVLYESRNLFSQDNDDNPTYNLANHIYKTFPIIYSQDNTTSIIARRWKGQLNENSKMLAFSNVIPEMNHNEIVGWENNSQLLKKISIIWLVDKDNHKRNILRMNQTNSLIKNFSSNQHFIEMKGDIGIERDLKFIHFGDWLSYWCAIFHKTDPTPVKKIDLLKNKLSESI